MSRRYSVLLTGHWDLSAEDLSGSFPSARDIQSSRGQTLTSREVLERVKTGIEVAVQKSKLSTGRVSGSRPDTFGSGPDLFGSSPDPFGSGPDPFSGDSDKRGAGLGEYPNVDSKIGSVQVTVLPFGPGSAVSESLEGNAWLAEGAHTGVAGSSNSWLSITADRNALSSFDLGVDLISVLDRPGWKIVEGGHSWSHDWGIGMIAALTDDQSLSAASTTDELRAAFKEARKRLAGQQIIFAASTERPLAGVGATSVLTPELQMRASAGLSNSWRNADQNRLQQLFREVFLETAASRKLNLRLESEGAFGGQKVDDNDPTGLPGSGSAAGAAAVFAALGFPIFPTATALASAVNLVEFINAADLVVVVEPHLDSPELAEATFSAITDLAANRGIPVVALGARASLSAHEQAQWGLHGITVLNIKKPFLEVFEDAGRRIAQTWLPR